MEIATEGKAYLLSYQCDVCSKGFLHATGNVKPSNPPLFENKCDNCGALADLPIDYPNTRIRSA